MNEFKMHQRIIQQILLVLCFLLSYNGVQGERKISKLENAALEKQLKLLNKPAVKIVKTKHGDVYDCVDFYKQHAFDHPLLKNHNFHPEMKPILSRIQKNSDASTTSWASTIWSSKDGGCPSGTVPVKRITKNDLIRHQHMPPPENININEQRGSYIRSRYKVAIARYPEDVNNKFAGAGMATSLYNPHVEGKQHSGCRLKIQKGRDILQVGWRVDPTLYGDNQTRLFIHFQTGTTQCFNTLCPGFIQVNTETPLDMSYEGHYSQRGVKIWEETMYIERDLVNGNWWLLMAENYEKIGFWPQKIFTDLKNFASSVDWGGVAYSPPNVPEPPMGTGGFPIQSWDYDAYCRSIAILNEEGKTVEVRIVHKHSDNNSMYSVWFERLPNQSKKYFTYVLYGGPGDERSAI